MTSARLRQAAVALAATLAPLFTAAQTDGVLPYLAFELGRSSPWPVPGPLARISLVGQAPWPRGGGQTFRGEVNTWAPSRMVAIKVGRDLGLAGPVAVSMGLAFARRSGYSQTFSTAFATLKQTGGGTVDVSASGEASGWTTLASHTLVLTVQVEPPRCRGVCPWAAAGLGASHMVVGAQTAALSGALHMRGPGFTVDDHLTRGEQQIARQAFHALAWQFEAGLGLDLAPDARLGAGVRIVHLGRYRLIDQTREWLLESRGEALRLVFSADPVRLTARELFISFRQSF